MTDPSALTHLDADGRARMVDVGDKDITRRTAIAGARLVTTPATIALIRDDGLKKADVLPTARIAGIQGAKRTSELIPLCHPLPLHSVRIEFGFEESAVAITVTATTTGRTGVEMEALTAAAITGLTLHDMVKAVDPAAAVTDVRLLEKTGGRRGHWRRDGTPPEPEESATVPQHRPRTAAVLVASTAGAAGTRDDTTGPVIADRLAAAGLAMEGVHVVPDAEVATALPALVRSGVALVVTTGGTGVSPTDATPEATAPLLDRPLPGLADAVRRAGEGAVPTAALSRGLAGVAGTCVVVNLPGSPGGVRDGLDVLLPVLDHLLAQVAGGGAHG